MDSAAIDEVTISEEYQIPMFPSEIKDKLSGVGPREITEQEILEVIEAFTKTAIRAKKHVLTVYSSLCPRFPFK
jgi:2,4-dienoyl-CoA reductase-like NADH-dependent reductase (Old Yellow Enzyme family)